MIRRLLVILALVLPLAASAQFKLPEIKVPGVPGVPGVPEVPKIPINIPGLDRIFQEGPALTTSLDDVHTDIAFLDDFNPQTVGSLQIMPRAADNNFPIIPGAWAIDVQSYCLHAGTHGPGGGDGYGYAPLAGPLSGVVRTVLKQSVVFPDIPQRQVQSLIWALIARAKISDLSPELRQVARQLLTAEQISRLDGGALAKIPVEFRGDVMAQAPPALRQILNAEATLRSMLTEAVDLPFHELERVAVLGGDPEPPEGSRPIPEARWSYHPDGVLVRFAPSGYSQTHLTLYAAEKILVGTDAEGRITHVEDLDGTTLAIDYAADDPLEFSGNSRMKGYAFDRLLFSTGGRDDAEETTVEHRGWTLVGESSGGGRIRGAVPDVFRGAEEAYRWATDFKAETERLAGAIGGESAPRRTVQNLLDLGQLIHGLRTGLGDDLPARHLELLYRAWAGQVLTLGGKVKVAAGPRPADVRLASLSGLAPSTVCRVWPIVVGQRWGGGGFDGSGGTATPGNRGRQRLGQSNRKNPNQGDWDRMQDANKNARRGYTAVNVAWRIGTGGGAPWAVPGWLLGKLIDRVTDLWRKASDALRGDPPRDDYDQIATVEVPDIPPATEGEGASAQRVAAVNALASESVLLLAQLRAANITLDRYGGAIRDNALEAAQRQIETLAALEHAAGNTMARVADRVEALRAVCEAEGYDVEITADDVRAYQDDLRQNGFDADSMRALEFLAASEEEMDWALQEHLAVDPDEATGSVLALMGFAAQATREMAEVLKSMPNPGMPQE